MRITRRNGDEYIGTAKIINRGADQNTTKREKYGSAGPKFGYSRCRGGRREDIGIYVRSAWEANYARYLIFLQANGKIKSWVYEPEEFRFPVRRGCVSYKPDFLVTENDGTEKYHEVKGWMDAKSKTKLRRFAKYYPSKTLVLIDEKEYKSLMRSVRGLIAME